MIKIGDGQTYDIKHFKTHELMCKCGCGKSDVNYKFLQMLDFARGIADVPFVLKSVIRCRTHNRNEGGVKNSEHVEGYGADIRAVDSSKRYKILKALFEVGFNRIGVYKTFIHVGMSPNKPNNVVWYK